MRPMGKGALAVSLIAVALSATVWLSLIGAPLGVAGLVLGGLAIKRARRDGRKTTMGWVAIGLSTLAVLALPFFGWACNSWLTCV